MNNIPQGWQCPSCKKIHAPSVVACNCVPVQTKEPPTWPSEPPYQPTITRDPFPPEKYMWTCDTMPKDDPAIYGSRNDILDPLLY